MRNYRQLAIEERENIQFGLWDKRSIREIAYELGRSPSTISREIERNHPPERRVYTPRLAQERAERKLRMRGQRPRLRNTLIREYIEEKLQLRWSPEQISGRLPLDHPGNTISHEAIYLYIYARCQREGYGPRCYGEDLRPYLRRHHKRRKRKHISPDSKRVMIPGRIGIEQRPAYIERRRQLGHWEGDSMVSKKNTTALNTLVERASGVVKITQIKNLSARETNRAIGERLGMLPPTLRRTLTRDNGHENKDHKLLSQTLGIQCYFCRPYHSYEKGTNENTNGLIRDYLPKGTDFATVGEERLNEIERALNSRPRKRYKYQTPLEVFTKGVALKG